VKLKANIGPNTPYELAIVEVNPNSIQKSHPKKVTFP
jgi:hypothetical protein